MKLRFLAEMFTGLLLVLGLVFGGPPAQAIDPTVLEDKYGVSFPIASLGGCADYSGCRTYCEDPVHATACIDFAKAKGFYQEEPVAKFVAILSTAGSVLGCDSLESCQNFCEIPANHDKCHSFARSAGLTGGYGQDPGKQEILSEAVDKLGCNSAEGCKGFCEKEENRVKCEAFAREVGLVGGTHSVGPGGCTSEGSCRAFCSDPGNFSICRNFAGVTGLNEFRGPGGCTSEDSCKAYCSSHPTQCPGFNSEGKTNYSPVEMCNRTPNCSWRGNSCACGFYGETEETRGKAEEYANYCRDNPTRCGPSEDAGFVNSQARQEFERYCRQSPERCRPPGNIGGFVESPAAACARYGCNWANNTCQCTSGNVTGGNTPSRESQEATCRAGGGVCVSWVNGACGCERSGSSGYNSCQLPSSGCSSNQYWDQAACSCRSSSNYTTCTPPISGCPSGWYWNASVCTCSQSGSYTAPSSCPSGQYWNGSSCVTSTTSTAPTMTRESQQSACSACGGTCNWNGDTCACQCTTTSGGSGSQSPEEACRQGTNCTWTGGSCQCTASEPTPSPSPSPSTDPATVCGQTSGCSWTGSTCQCGSTQGVSTEQNFLQTLFDFFSGWFKQ